jgi:hypothetical protein
MRRPNEDRSGGKASSWDFEEAGRAAAAEGLRLTPAERLRWLDETMAELQGLLGRARSDPPAGEQ